jgi:two-component system NtrC family sensor kinase
MDLMGTILVVDDNGVNRLLLSQHVKQCGHNVVVAESGQRALAVLASQEIDMILLDVLMPELDGYELLVRLQATPRLREIPVVMVSGVDEVESVARCIEAGATDYLAKPVDPILLRSRITACLEKKRLRDQEQRKTEELERTLAQLKATQEQLLVQQKLASLGQLTAGIAHEIKNPLNFVINFARLCDPLLHELLGQVDQVGECLRESARANLRETIHLLKQNLAKINEHGKRADAIVRGMLQHSRTSSGEFQDVDLNALVSEYVHLAVNGLRASDPTLHTAISISLDERVGSVRGVPQDLSQVIMNIVSNACQAMSNKRQYAGPDYVPQLLVQTRLLEESVAIHIRDNGPGVPDELRERIFQPFFTTKPSGQGTGLGLSISYDIVVQKHRGQLELQTVPGQYAEFIVRLPRGRPAAG